MNTAPLRAGSRIYHYPCKGIAYTVVAGRHRFAGLINQGAVKTERADDENIAEHSFGGLG